MHRFGSQVPDAIAHRVADVKPEIRIFPDLEALSRAAAEAWIRACARAVADRGRFLVALSGGTTPARLYQLLGQSPFREQVDWAHLQAFWGDERCVPVEDLENNYRQAHDVLLGHVPTPPENIHRIRSELDPTEAAEDYALVLRQFAAPPLDWPRFDLILLGMGDDGHTASLFPGSDPNAAGAVIAAQGAYQNRPAWRVTLTETVLNSGRQILFLVSGQSKAPIVASVLNGDFRPEALPAQRIRPDDGELVWMLDQNAAALI